MHINVNSCFTSWYNSEKTNSFSTDGISSFRIVELANNAPPTTSLISISILPPVRFILKNITTSSLIIYFLRFSDLILYSLSPLYSSRTTFVTRFRPLSTSSRLTLVFCGPASSEKHTDNFIPLCDAIESIDTLLKYLSQDARPTPLPPISFFNLECSLKNESRFTSLKPSPLSTISMLLSVPSSNELITTWILSAFA